MAREGYSPVVRVVRELDVPGLRRSYRPGATLFCEDDVADRVHVIEAGAVKLWASSPMGETVIDFRAPGDVAGDLAALHAGRRSASATAVLETELLLLRSSDLRHALVRRPAAGLELVAALASQLAGARREAVELASRDVIGRVSLRLIQLCECFGEPLSGGVRIALPITQTELASWCGSSREATVRALAQLRRTGVVSTSRRTLVVTDVDALLRARAA